LLQFQRAGFVHKGGLLPASVIAVSQKTSSVFFGMMIKAAGMSVSFYLIVFVLVLLSWASTTSHAYVWPASPIPPRFVTSMNVGHLSLVGSGPGDPDLLTVQAIRMIKNASLVVADRLIAPEILSLVECELRIARKRPGCAEEAQAELYEWVTEALLQDKNVVRLKIGDPFLFGRGGEEVLYFHEKLGIQAQVCAGVSSSYAAPLAANIPLTHRGLANQVLISTGYGKGGVEVEVPEYCNDRTIVLLMAVGRIEEIACSMVAKGFPSTTPVAIVERATTPLQRTMIGDLSNIADIAKHQVATAPATIIIGECVLALDKTHTQTQ